ncbi:hypothetical protein A3SI_19019 [Nitritalea halalkaliphila LW7]|uniref:Uncharacterized protein n=1 Tax=Nitritalea halalkaliphila LW7 TaxID=1189621 RepID=I5BTL9_9BACT|nr:hypothetical protein A3SI_19019 [Nitritalea halalkaliphila LW7]
MGDFDLGFRYDFRPTLIWMLRHFAWGYRPQATKKSAAKRLGIYACKRMPLNSHFQCVSVLPRLRH